MAEWTHPLCTHCYGELEPGREPYRFTPETRILERCCRCSIPTMSGIYYRAAPLELACKGIHGAALTPTVTIDQLPWLGLPRLGDFIRTASAPEPHEYSPRMRDPFEPWLPTMPGTYLQFAGTWPWPTCRRCRILGRLRLWSLRARHQRRRHASTA